MARRITCRGSHVHGPVPAPGRPDPHVDRAGRLDRRPKTDSPGVNFAGGNAWRDVGTWAAAPAVTNGSLVELSDLHAWLGLRNSDDQGTQFDLRATVFRNGTQLAEGLQRCITSLTRNPSLAREVTVSFGAPTILTFNGTSDVLTLRLSTRIGTTDSNAKCTRPRRQPQQRDRTAALLRFDVAAGALRRHDRARRQGCPNQRGRVALSGSPGDWVELYNPTTRAVRPLVPRLPRQRRQREPQIRHPERDLDRRPAAMSSSTNSWRRREALQLRTRSAADSARLLRARRQPRSSTAIRWTAACLHDLRSLPERDRRLQEHDRRCTKGAANDCSVPVKLNEVESSTATSPAA